MNLYDVYRVPPAPHAADCTCAACDETPLTLERIDRMELALRPRLRALHRERVTARATLRYITDEKPCPHCGSVGNECFGDLDTITRRLLRDARAALRVDVTPPNRAAYLAVLNDAASRCRDGYAYVRLANVRVGDDHRRRADVVESWYEPTPYDLEDFAGDFGSALAFVRCDSFGVLLPSSWIPAAGKSVFVDSGIVGTFAVSY